MNRVKTKSPRMTPQQFMTLLVTIVGSGIVMLDGTVVNLALPALKGELGATFSDLQWVVDGYLLSLSALILLGGSLGDIFGRKRVYIIGLIGFGAVSVACGFAQDTTTLIIMRVLQGVFGALLVPGGLAIINTNFPPEQRGKAIGRWAAWSGIATAVGPLLGGYLIDSFSWRWVFFLNVPLIILCVLLALPNVRETKTAAVRRVDFAGATLAMAFLACVTYGLIEGPNRQWDAITTGLLLAGCALFIAFLVVECRRRDPMVDLKLFASRNFTGANIMTFAMYGALSGFFFALLIYLQTTLHYTSVQAGLSILPVTLLLFLFSGKMGGLTQTFGPRLFMTIGPLIAALGMFLLVTLAPGADYWWHILPGVTLFGAGLCLMVAPLTVTVMASVDDAHSGIASGINNAISRASALIVIALLGLVGAGNNYQFSVWLCVALAVAAAVTSFLFIRNPKRRKCCYNKFQ